MVTLRHRDWAWLSPTSCASSLPASPSATAGRAETSRSASPSSRLSEGSEQNAQSQCERLNSQTIKKCAGQLFNFHSENRRGPVPYCSCGLLKHSGAFGGYKFHASPNFAWISSNSVRRFRICAVAQIGPAPLDCKSWFVSQAIACQACLEPALPLLAMLI